MKKVVCIIFLVLIFSVMAYAEEVEVTIPEFEVVLNDVSINSSIAEYPLIMYNSVTYIPMTWNMCQSLGLSLQYDSITGLKIDLLNVKEPIVADTLGDNEAVLPMATLAEYPVFVNGVDIDNKVELYPILNFRGITYFPLTWRFAHDSFGWDYKFSQADGLSITSKLEEPVKTVNEVEEVKEIEHEYSKLFLEKYSSEFFTHTYLEGLEIAEAIKGTVLYKRWVHYLDPYDQLITYSYHPDYQYKQILNDKDTTHFGSSEGYNKFSQEVNISKKYGMGNAIIFHDDCAYLSGYKDEVSKKATHYMPLHKYNDLTREENINGAMISKIDGEYVVDYVDFILAYENDETVSIEIYDPLSEASIKILKMALEYVYPEEDYEVMTEYLLSIIEKRYNDSENPLTVDIDGEPYNTELYVNGYYIALGEEEVDYADRDTVCLKIILK